MRKIFAYTRVSTPLGKNVNKVSKKQTEERQKMDRQNITLETYAAENGFSIDSWVRDYLSGATPFDERKGYPEMRKDMRRGDILIVTDLDRLGRNADALKKEIMLLKEDGVKIAMLDVPYLNDWAFVTSEEDSSIYDMIIDVVITVKVHMAQQEREKIQARINQGLDAARAKGVKLGRKPTGVPASFEKEYRKYKDGTKYSGMNVTEFARTIGVARPTVYKYAKILEKQGES